MASPFTKMPRGWLSAVSLALFFLDFLLAGVLFIVNFFVPLPFIAKAYIFISLPVGVLTYYLACVEKAPPR